MASQKQTQGYPCAWRDRTQEPEAQLLPWFAVNGGYTGACCVVCMGGGSRYHLQKQNNYNNYLYEEKVLLHISAYLGT